MRALQKSLTPVHTSLLTVLSIVGKKGYYARTNEELRLFQDLQSLDYVTLKKGTKKVFILTEKGLKFLEETQNNHVAEKKEKGRRITKKRFWKLIKEAYQVYSSPMRPIVKIPLIREYVLKKTQITSEKFDTMLLQLFSEGVVELQTSLNAQEAPGGIPTHNGILYYLTILEQ